MSMICIWICVSSLIPVIGFVLDCSLCLCLTVQFWCLVVSDRPRLLRVCWSTTFLTFCYLVTLLYLILLFSVLLNLWPTSLYLICSIVTDRLSFLHFPDFTHEQARLDIDCLNYEMRFVFILSWLYGLLIFMTCL
jgi:hypothetical protein